MPRPPQTTTHFIGKLCILARKSAQETPFSFPPIGMSRRRTGNPAETSFETNGEAIVSRSGMIRPSIRNDGRQRSSASILDSSRLAEIRGMVRKRSTSTPIRFPPFAMPRSSCRTRVLPSRGEAPTLRSRRRPDLRPSVSNVRWCPLRSRVPRGSCQPDRQAG